MRKIEKLLPGEFEMYPNPVVNTDDQRATPLAERRWKSGFGSNFKLLPPVSRGPVHFWDVSERCSKF